MDMATKRYILATAVSFLVFGFAGMAQAQGAAPRLFFEGDVVRSVPPTGPTGAVCVLNSQFKHKEQIAWRVRVLDGKTGKQLDDKGLKSLVVVLSDGQTIAMRFGGHPNRGPHTDHFWSTSWLIPDTYPTGSFTYKVVATDKKGHATSWSPFNVGLSQLAVIPGDLAPPSGPPK
jgi:hypothetical protein